MKNKINRNLILIVIVIIIVAIIGTTICKNILIKADKSLLAVNSYSNFAWSPSFSGTAIFDDGTIYSWKFHGTSNMDYKKYIGMNNIDTKKGLEKFIIKKGSKKIKYVSQNDLKLLKELINNLSVDNTNYQKECHGADMGTSSISVYKENEEYKLAEYGDCDGESKSNNVQELLTLIKKYN